MADMGSTVFREATLDDYEAVLAIDANMSDGLDYLPFMYKHFIEDPKRTCYVLEQKGKIVGFASISIVDDQQTLVSRAGRVLDSKRAAGLWTYFRNELVVRIRQKYPGAKFLVMTTVLKELILSKIRNGDWEYNFVLTRPHIIMTLRPGNRAAVNSRALNSSVKSVDRNTLKSVLADPDNHWRLFPNGRVIISHDPYRVIPSNYDSILNLCDEVLCTFERNGSSYDPVRCSSISFAKYYETKAGLRYDIEIYSSDLQESLDHICKHVQLSYKYYRNGVHSIWIFIPINLSLEDVTQHLRQSFLIQGDLELTSTSLFEADLSIHSKL